MSTNRLGFLMIILLAESFGAAEEPSPAVRMTLAPAVVLTHTAPCPQPCPTCQTAVTRALTYLAQQPLLNDGRGPKPPYRYVETAIRGLAFLAEGSTRTQGKYHEQVAQAVTYLLGLGEKWRQKASPSLVNYPQGNLSWAALFLSEVYRREPDDQDIRKELESLADAIEGSRMKNGLWCYGTLDFMDRQKSGIGHIFSTSVCLLAQARLEAAKIPTSFNRRLKEMQYFYDAIIAKNGYCWNYSGMPKAPLSDDPNYDGSKDPSFPAAGRTGLTILAMRTLHLERTDSYQRALAHFRKNLDDVYTHHVPQMYILLAGLLCHELGEPDWEAFLKIYRDGMLRQQQADGRLARLFKIDPAMASQRAFDDTIPVMPTYPTAIMAILLQLPLDHFNLP